jgi:hypothetical protein
VRAEQGRELAAPLDPHRAGCKVESYGGGCVRELVMMSGSVAGAERGEPFYRIKKPNATSGGTTPCAWVASCTSCALK